VFPKKDLPFFILFTAGLCSGTATLALLTHQYPEYTAYVFRLVSILNMKTSNLYNQIIQLVNYQNVI